MAHDNYLKLKEKVFKIRTESKSVYEVIVRTQDTLLEFGIKISFKSYPMSFSTEVSNSHSSPIGYETNWCKRDTDKVSSYPGWYGQWKGSLEILDLSLCEGIFSDSGHDPGLRDLSHVVNFINTETGSPGANFNVEGKLFLYDFPLINEEYSMSGDMEKSILNRNFTKCAIRFQEKHREELAKYIKKSPVNNELIEKQDKLGKLKTSLFKLQCENEKFLKNKFNSKYIDKLPMPPSQFGTDLKILDYVVPNTSFKYQEKKVHEECIKSLNLAKQIIKEMEELIDNYPEKFI